MRWAPGYWWEVDGGFRWVSPGGVLAVVVWLIASAAFAFYVANFGSYNKTYGALAGVIVFLVWMWITNIAVLLGAELNAETERARELEAGVPGAKEDIQAPYRDVPEEERPLLRALLDEDGPLLT
jgi:membrane protein